MEHENYITRKRAKFEAICGHVNIPYGTALINQGGFLMWNGKQICGITSQNAFDFFSHNDDGRGRERGDLVSAILIQLERRTKTTRAGGIRFGPIPFVKSTKGRSMKIIGFGTMPFTMPRLKICNISLT